MTTTIEIIRTKVHNEHKGVPVGKVHILLTRIAATIDKGSITNRAPLCTASFP